MSGYFFGDMSNLITGYYAADLPSAWYSGNEVTIAQFVSSYANGGQNASWPILAGGLSSSVSLSSNINDLITGNLNCFYKTPFTQSTPWGSQVPSVHTDFTPLDIARLFWPNVNWEE
jgi:hypothetical protein